MSTLLKDYLNTKFPVYNDDWKNSDIISHFITEFGVDVKPEVHTDGKDLFLFKYDMLGAKWNHEITHECRGVILRNSDIGWEVMSFPFKKFFNQAEGHCPIFKEEDFIKELPNLSFADKLDGTCIQVYFDSYMYKWRISTLGTITTMNIHDSGITFDSLFKKTIGTDIFNNLEKGNTYLFELCTTLNRVVSRYSSDRAYLIGIRNMDGNLISYKDIKQYHRILWDNPYYKIFLPECIPLSDCGIVSLDDANKWVEKQSSRKDISEYPEGYIVYNQFGPVCKMKNSVYLALHHSLSDAACTRNAVIASFFKGTMDDLYPALPEPFQKFADKLKDWLNDFKNYLNTQVAIPFHGEPFKTRKDYALYVQALPEREQMFRAFFFALQEDICDPTKNLGDVFTKWIIQNFEKYEDYWKSLNI